MSVAENRMNTCFCADVARKSISGPRGRACSTDWWGYKVTRLVSSVVRLTWFFHVQHISALIPLCVGDRPRAPPSNHHGSALDSAGHGLIQWLPWRGNATDRLQCHILCMYITATPCCCCVERLGLLRGRRFDDWFRANWKSTPRRLI